MKYSILDSEFERTQRQKLFKRSCSKLIFKIFNMKLKTYLFELLCNFNFNFLICFFKYFKNNK